jgi:serine/threonine protein kinase
LLIAHDHSLKLADFGFARFFASPEQHLSYEACTLWYRSPEMLFGSTFYSTPADIWSVGCIMAYLMRREPLFKGNEEV